MYALFSKFQNEVWMGFLGFMGACVRVAMGYYNDERMEASLIFATVATGSILAGTSHNLLVAELGLGGGSAAACSFIIGIMGMKVVTQVMAYEFPSLFGGKK